LIQKTTLESPVQSPFPRAQGILGRTGIQNYAAAANTAGRAGIVRRLLSAKTEDRGFRVDLQHSVEFVTRFINASKTDKDHYFGSAGGVHTRLMVHPLPLNNLLPVLRRLRLPCRRISFNGRCYYLSRSMIMLAGDLHAEPAISGDLSAAA